jgi:hypothetical protein
VAADYAVQLIDVAAFNEVVQHFQDAARAGIERGLCNDLVPAAKAVLDQQVFVECPHLAEAGGGVQGRRSGDRYLDCDVLGDLSPLPGGDRRGAAAHDSPLII